MGSVPGSLYLNAFFGFGRGRPYCQLTRCNALAAMSIDEIPLLLPAQMLRSNDLFSERIDSSTPTTSIHFQKYSLQIAALRAIKCKAIAKGFYEGCQQRVLGSGLYRPAVSCPHRDTRLIDIHRD